MILFKIRILGAPYKLRLNEPNSMSVILTLMRGIDAGNHCDIAVFKDSAQLHLA
jgi:hypothetical protein